MTVSVENKDIKIPAQHYVGFNKRGADEVPLGFLTPDGTDEAAVKRKATVDQWAKGYGNRGDAKLPAKTLENKPLSGFKFGNSVKHGYGWGQGNVKWRVEDPRGFELEISSPNLAQIMAICTIENGEILDQCIWGRLKSENILIPVTSDVYKTAAANTERANKTASIKDLKPGHSVVLQNGIEGRYLGSHYILSTEYGKVKCSDKKRHLIVSEDRIHDIASLKLSEIIASNELTIEAAEIELNRIIKEGTHAGPRGVSNKASKDPAVYSFEPADISYFKKNRTDHAAVEVNDELYLISVWYLEYQHYSQIDGSRLIKDKFLAGDGLEHAGRWNSGQIKINKPVKEPTYRLVGKYISSNSGEIEINI